MQQRPFWQISPVRHQEAGLTKDIIFLLLAFPLYLFCFSMYKRSLIGSKVVFPKFREIQLCTTSLKPHHSRGQLLQQRYLEAGKLGLWGATSHLR
jgi:hypothetical protein